MEQSFRKFFSKLRYLTKLYTGRLRPEVQPLAHLYIPFTEKRYPFHIPTLEHCIPFLRPCNEVNEQYYGRISSIIRRNVKQTSPFGHPTQVSAQVQLAPSCDYLPVRLTTA